MAEHPAGHLVLKWLIKQDKDLKEHSKEGKIMHSERFQEFYSEYKREKK